MDADWHAVCQVIYKGIEGKDWEELYDYYKEMSRAAGVKKPNENQKAKAILENEGSQGQERDFYDQNAKDNTLGSNKTRLELWDEHLKDPIVALDSVEVR